MADLPTDPDALVASFCAAWKRMDVDELMSYFADEAVYHNIPMDPTEGSDAIREFLAGFFTMAQSIEFDTKHQVASGKVVMNERVDTIVMGDSTTELPVAGIFEVTDGKITAWRDYFDMGQMTGS